MSLKSKVSIYISVSLIIVLVGAISAVTPILVMKSKTQQITESYESQVKLYKETISEQDELIKESERVNEDLCSEIEKISSYDVNVYSVPKGHNSFKTYMDYKRLSKSFEGRKIVETGYVDEFGLRRVNGAYCVALGTYYGRVGDIFRVTLSTGVQVKVIKCDTKSDDHTDSTHRYTTKSNCMMEFLVDESKLSGDISSSGNVSTGTELGGLIVSIVRER